MPRIALGSDTGGSIRQPAALCGVVGAKPTYGMVSRYGLVAFASSLDQIGPFATSVADAALALDTISGHDEADSTSLPTESARARENLGRGVEGLRVGVIAELAGADGIAPDVAARIREAAEALAAAGAKVEETSVPAVRYGLSAYYMIAPAEASSNLARYDGVRYGLRKPGADITEMYMATRSAGFGPEVKRRIMLGTYVLSAGYYDAYYGKSQRVRTLIIRDFEEAYRSFDVLLSPTAPTTAFELGTKTSDPLTMYLSDVCTIPSNLAGHPAISVPFGTGDDGLPVGAQVLAPGRRRARHVPGGRSPRSGGCRERRWEMSQSGQTAPVERLGNGGGSRGALRAADADQVVLRVPQRLRRRAQYQRVPRVPGPARFFAGAQRAGGRVRPAHRRRPALPAPSHRFSTGKTIFTPTCPRTTR